MPTVGTEPSSYNPPHTTLLNNPFLSAAGAAQQPVEPMRAEQQEHPEQQAAPAQQRATLSAAARQAPAPPEAKNHTRAAPPEAPRPALALVSGSQADLALPKPQRPARADVETAVVACAVAVLNRLDTRRRNVFQLPGQPRTAFAQASVSAMAKALLRLDSRQAGLSAAVSAAEALAARAHLVDELTARGREIDLVHAFMLRSKSNRRWMNKLPQYPHPIGQAPDFVVVLREVDANLEAAQAWDTAGRLLGHDSESLAAWTTYLSARRMVPASADVETRRKALTDWAAGAPTAEGREQLMRVAQEFRSKAGAFFDPYRPSEAHEAMFIDAWFEEEEDLAQAGR